MAKRKIVILGEDDILSKKCRRVEKFDEKLCEILDDMAEIMYDAGGAGLAAPQVGLLRRIAVIDVGEGLIELVNPEIIAAEGKKIDVEGCLSVPGKAGMVERPEKVTVRAQNREGEEFEITAEGMLCKCLCHEIDHLDGIVYTDKMIEDVSDRYRMVTKGDK